MPKITKPTSSDAFAAVAVAVTDLRAAQDFVLKPPFPPTSALHGQHVKWQKYLSDLPAKNERERERGRIHEISYIYSGPESKAYIGLLLAGSAGKALIKCGQGSARASSLNAHNARAQGATH